MAEISMQCPYCRNVLTVDSALCGQKVACQFCNAQVMVQAEKNTVSLVLGILGLVFFGCAGWIFSLIALILGIKKNYKTGVILGIIGLVLHGLVLFIFVLAAILLPAFAGAREQAQKLTCIMNLKQVGLAVVMYADDNDDHLPASLDDVQEYIGSLDFFCCPSDESGRSYVYVGGDRRVLDSRPIAFDFPGNHPGKVNVLWSDGHVETVTTNIKSLDELIEFLQILPPAFFSP